MANRKLELKITTDSSNQHVYIDNMSIYALQQLNVLIDSLVKIINASPQSSGIRVKLVKGSAALIAEGSDASIGALQDDFIEVLEGKSKKKEIVTGWKHIQNVINLNGLHYEINFIDTNNVVVPFVERFKNRKPFRVRVTRKVKDYKLVFLNGELTDSGGVKPNMHIAEDNEDAIVRCSKEIAKKMGSDFLYSHIYVSAWCRTAESVKPTYDFCDFYLNEQIYNEYKMFVENVAEMDESDEYVQIHRKLKEYIESNEFGKIKKFLRLYDHHSSDIGSLKTILLITKTFKEREDIGELRAKIKELLDDKLGIAKVQH